jgi:hypothetical protein
MYTFVHVHAHQRTSHITLLASAAALLGQEIFVAGGQADKEVINSAEIYNPELNQWEQMVARMEVPRVGLAMVSMGNLIYAIGEEFYMMYMCRQCCVAIHMFKDGWIPPVKFVAQASGHECDW